MTRRESQIIKGVAILLMLFLHLFNQTANVDLCANFIYVGSVPLVNYMSRAADPVSFFLILGGYGLYTVWRNGADRHHYSRLLKLMVHYWTILLIFVYIGHLIYPDRYPGSLTSLIGNITAFNTTYNSEMWFLLPYMTLSLCAPWYFRVTGKIRIRYIVLGTFMINLATTYIIGHFGPVYLYGNMWIFNPIPVFHLLFDFTLGAMAARCGLFQVVKDKGSDISRKYKWLIWCGITLVFVVKCMFRYFFGYAFIMIALILIAPRWRWIDNILNKLGGQSMNMWMIHTWFCYYLFHDFIYSFRYPLLIFAVLAIISYTCSLLINILTLPIEKTLISKSEIKEKPIL